MGGWVRPQQPWLVTCWIPNHTCYPVGTITELQSSLVPSLKLTASLPLKMGWLEFPILSYWGVKRPIFRGYVLLAAFQGPVNCTVFTWLLLSFGTLQIGPNLGRPEKSIDSNTSASKKGKGGPRFQEGSCWLVLSSQLRNIPSSQNRSK